MKKYIFLDISKAYSHPRKTLWNHINEIIWFGEEFMKLGYKFDIDYLKILAFFHDIGKSYIEWQKYISGEINDRVKHSGISSLLFFLIAHNKEDILNEIGFDISNISSLYKSLGIDLSKFDRNLIDLFTYLILVHHSSLKLIKSDGNNAYYDFFSKFENSKWREIINKLQESGDISYVRSIVNIKSNVLKKLDKEQKYNILNTYAVFKISDMLSGSFHRNLKREEIPSILYSYGILDLDYKINSENDIIGLLKILTKKEIDKNRLKDQIKFLNENINILLAPTGFGKTTFSILKGINNKRALILLPTITSIEQFLSRAKEIIREIGYPENTVGTYYYFYNPFEKIGEDYKPTNEYFLSRYLLKPFMITSIDQILLLYLQTKEYYIKKLALQNRIFIVDEVHLLSPKMLWLLIRFIKDNKYLFSNKNVVFMSATFPGYLRDLIKKELSDILGENANNELLLYDYYPNNRIMIESIIDNNLFVDESKKEKLFEDILNKIKEILNKKHNAKILIMFNTVKNAQDFYDFLKGRFSNGNLLLFHSRYIYKHRKEKEKKILNIKNDREPFILIATQVVEVSLDIDFDFLITEIAPLPDLIQRFGRVYRNRKNEELPPKDANIHIFPFLKESENIYEKEEIEVSYSIIKEFLGKVVDEKSLINKLETSEFGNVFLKEYEETKNKYEKDINNMLDLYSSYFLYIFSEDEEGAKQEISELLNIRDDINVLTMIDPDLLDKNEKNRLIKIINNLRKSIKDRIFTEYFKYKLELRNYMISLPLYYILDKKVEIKEFEDSGIPIITGEKDIYSKEYGLKIKYVDI